MLSLTAAFENDCAWCVAFHTAMALKEGVTQAAVDALRRGEAPADPRLAALSRFARAMVRNRGRSTRDAAGVPRRRLLAAAGAGRGDGPGVLADGQLRGAPHAPGRRRLSEAASPGRRLTIMAADGARRPTHADPAPSALGALLQYWRRARNLSQLALAHEADVSPRHVCFLETGRAKPSRDMVLLLADTLGVPLRERNALLLAAGFAPMFRESTLDDPELAPVRTAIDAILKQQEPYPAVVMNRRWDIVATNGAASRFFGLLLGGRTPRGAGNVLRLMFHPDGLRPCRRKLGGGGAGAGPSCASRSARRRARRRRAALLSEVLDYPGVPARWRTPDLGAPRGPGRARSASGTANAALPLLLRRHGARHAAGHHAAGAAHRVLLPAGRSHRHGSGASPRLILEYPQDVITQTAHIGSHRRAARRRS